MSSSPSWLADADEAARILPRVCRAYRLPEPIDFERDTQGLLIAVGSGLMMATMDAVPELRWCIDIGGGIDYSGLPEAAPWLDRLVPLVVVHAWFSVSAPSPLRQTLPLLCRPRVVVKSNVDLGTFQVGTFAELRAAARLRGSRSGEHGRIPTLSQSGAGGT